MTDTLNDVDSKQTCSGNCNTSKVVGATSREGLSDVLRKLAQVYQLDTHSDYIGLIPARLPLDTLVFPRMNVTH